MLLEPIVAAFIITLGTILYYLTRNYSYWMKKGVDFIPPKFPFGISHSQFFGTAYAGSYSRQFYLKYKLQGLTFVGAFTMNQPTLFVLDLDLLRNILTKDFNHFTSRDMIPTSHEFISKHLFALEGQEWKEMRVKLTPIFTSGKIKNMFHLMAACADNMTEYVDAEILQKGQFKVKDLTARFTTDVIATCAFGLEINCFKNKDNEFFAIGQLIFLPSPTLVIKMFLQRHFPTFSKIMNINVFQPRISELLSSFLEDTIKYRKTNNFYRNDFVDLLLGIKNKKPVPGSDDNQQCTHSENTSTACSETKGNHVNSYSFKDDLTFQEMTAQAFVFFAAGLETASSTMSFCLFELANNREVQERIHQEVDKILAVHEGKITYQALQDMRYLDQVINETLRMYPSLPVVNRVCTERYVVPGTDVVVDEGVRVHIPTFAIHHDPEFYPDPFRFDPDRFSEENSKGRHPYAFIPFGEGPRMCIGMRFGILQMKMGLATLMANYEVGPTPGAPPRIELDPFTPLTSAKHPFSLTISRRS